MHFYLAYCRPKTSNQPAGTRLDCSHYNQQCCLYAAVAVILLLLTVNRVLRVVLYIYLTSDH